MKQLNLSDVRAKLSPTLKTINRGVVAIKVRGQVAAYLVSRADYEALLQRQPKAKKYFVATGTLTIVGDDNTLSASEATLREAGESWDRQNS